MPRRRTWALPLVALAAATAFAWPRPAASEPPPASQPVPLAVGPIAYYTASCARCHGDVSAAYVGVTNPKRGAELKHVIDDMAYGPAQSPIEGEALNQQTLLHEAMFGKTPFVWLDAGKKDVTAGEVLPGTTLSFEPATPVKIDGTRFELAKKPGTLLAERDGKTVRVIVR